MNWFLKRAMALEENKEGGGNSPPPPNPQDALIAELKKKIEGNESEIERLKKDAKRAKGEKDEIKVGASEDSINALLESNRAMLAILNEMKNAPKAPISRKKWAFWSL